MRVLVACEESQAVTAELRARGLEAYSCDLRPTRGSHPEWHLQRDVFRVLEEDGVWDMMLAFPPCTHLASSGARHFAAKRADGRQQEGIDFFLRLTRTGIPRWAIENPVGIMSTHFRKPDQIIQPFHFGDSAQKTTCLWLHNLPVLQPTHIVSPGEFVTFPSKDGRRRAVRQPAWYYETLKLSPEARALARSATFPGIARAMATQWTAVAHHLRNV